MSYPAPVYVLSPISLKNSETNQILQLGRYIVIIPEIKEYNLSYLDMSGEFNNAIASQINQIIDAVVNDRIPDGIFVSSNMKSDIIREKKDDIMLICYIKEYRESTQNQFIVHSNCDFSKFGFDPNNQIETNGLLKKENLYAHKLDINLICNDDQLFFAYNETEKNIDINELNPILAKFLTVDLL